MLINVCMNVFANANKGYLNVIFRVVTDYHTLLSLAGVRSSLWSVRFTASRSTVFKPIKVNFTSSLKVNTSVLKLSSLLVYWIINRTSLYQTIPDFTKPW